MYTYNSGICNSRMDVNQTKANQETLHLQQSECMLEALRIPTSDTSIAIFKLLKRVSIL